MQNPTTQYEVRAIPAMGFTHRWCAQRPWSKEPQLVRVVDHPKPPLITQLERGQKSYQYFDEISPLELAELKADTHIAVSFVGEGVVGADELNDAKARVLTLRRELDDARRDLQGIQEELKAHRFAGQELTEANAKKIAELESAIATTKTQIERKQSTPTP